MATLINDENDIKTKQEQQQLVLIEGDGSVIPATDDVIMDVDHGKIKQPGRPFTTIATTDSTRNEDVTKFELAGHVKLEITHNSEELNSSLQVERIQLPGESHDRSLRHTAADICAPSSRINSNDCKGKRLIQDFSKENAAGSLLLNDGLIALTESAEIVSGRRNGALTDTISVSDIYISRTPDFSILKGEICLDNLSIRELQEAFRASFGRHTTVKDKLWLKRRIAMGLINSCDIPTTSFAIKNNKIICKDIKEEASCRLSGLNHEVNSMVRDEISEFPSACSETLLTTNKLTHKQLTESTSTHNEDCHVDQFGAKRARKPTRRYIEEFSDLETRECSAKVSGDFKSSSKYQTGFLSDISKRKNFAIRYDSFGGFGILIPYASRVRIGRPRKNVMALMKYHPSGKSNDIVEMDCSAPPEEKKTGSFPVCLLEPSFLNMEKVEVDSEKLLCKDEPYIENNGPDLYGDNRDDNIDSQSLEKTVGKRKHHRAWTLCEIQKLVEGVATYGAGRWSEIRRLVFTSYSYRTSVDLKDKWRNLLRASLAQGPAGKGAGNLRKQTSVPIPPAVLSQVRELAELNGQTGIQLRPSKVARHEVNAAKGTDSGFL